LSVTLYHFNVGSHFNNEFVANAWLMVDFFFVLSGFVISLNYQSRIDSVTNLFHFQYKRFLRLYPLHLLMLMAFLGIEVARYFAEVQFNMVTSSRAFSENNFISFIANIFLLQNWTQSSLTWNFPSWSISAEFYTYAIFGLTVLLSQKYKLLMSVVSILFVLGAGSILLEKGMGTDYVTGPSRCIYSFFYRCFDIQYL
jgi:peptidoglycan/LPS O-acetylase OafA/YrhL